MHHIFTKMTKLKIFIPFFLFAFFCESFATSYYFFVAFKDKANTPYSLSNPSAYLSQRAIDRRSFFSVVIDSLDIPVNETYIQQVQSLGAAIHCKSKWMNGVTIMLTDSSLITQVQNLNCVQSIQYTGKNATPLWKSAKNNSDFLAIDYGVAKKQIEQVHGDYLHDLGYKGSGIHIGLLDAGYLNVNVNHAFDSIRSANRFLGAKDFVNPNSDIYAEHPHGANVLSIIGGNLTAQYFGSAPEASFLIIRTENAPTEYLMETDFWVSGIEYADSAGIDIVNSSLGYTEFDDAATNFTYADMNGTVARASRAATIASQKGIVVVNSAGNDGQNPWKYIGVPADAKEIIAVGNVDSLGVISPYSSIGPSSDGRVKPEICAMGTATGYVSTSGSFTRGSGTSYSAPVITGLTACYLQYMRTNNPNFTIQALQQSIFESANQYASPTDQMGYGIPNYEQAVANITKITNYQNNQRDFKIITDAKNKKIGVHFSSDFSDNKKIALYNLAGVCLFSEQTNDKLMLISTENYNAGVYVIHAKIGSKQFAEKVIIY